MDLPDNVAAASAAFGNGGADAGAARVPDTSCLLWPTDLSGILAVSGSALQVVELFEVPSTDRVVAGVAAACPYLHTLVIECRYGLGACPYISSSSLCKGNQVPLCLSTAGHQAYAQQQAPSHSLNCAGAPVLCADHHQQSSAACHLQACSPCHSSIGCAHCC